MFNFFQLCLAAVLTTAHARSASSFQPASDYGVHKTTDLYNCTGKNFVSNVTVPNAVDTLPQIKPFSTHGWEQWSLSLHGTFPMILRWNKGDPSVPGPSPSHFDILVGGVNGTTIQATVIGDLSYMNSENVKKIVIGNNSLTWGSDALWYNVSVSIEGYVLELDSYSATHDVFHPNVEFYNGLLDKTGDWYGSVPLVRGHVAIGNLYTPTTEKIKLGGLTVLKHMFSENPLPSYIDNYVAGTFWGYSTTFYDTHVFYQTETTNGTVHEAAFLGRAIPVAGEEGVFSSAWATYAVTDDPLYNLSINDETSGINASFPGCASTSNISYWFNISALMLLGEITDTGGGVTSYYIVRNGTTTAPFEDGIKNGSVAGIFEEYLAPC